MVATIKQLIGKVNFDYSENGKDLLKEFGSVEKIPAEKIKVKPLVEHKLVYDSATEQLEPVYFFILDLMNDFGMGTEKLMDNFTSSPGSGHFSELGQRATIMQQQGFKVMGDINTILRSVLNIIYDLKDFRTRLAIYDDFNSKNKETSEAARLGLKQIWLDKVDIARGQGSIHAMATGQLGFQTLRDAFLAVKDEKLKDANGNEIDLNDRVKRILRARILEFNTWLEHSGQELKKRYNLERTYLKTQVNSLKLYSRWAKPYLKAAQDLTMMETDREAALVKTFNTILLELSIFGKNKIKVEDEALSGNFPAHFAKLKLKRDYFACVLVDFRFRGIPQRVAQQQHYAFGGRAEITFSAYALNSDELDMLNKELDKSDVGDALKLIEGTTTESLEQLQKEIDYFLEEKEEDGDKEDKEKKSSSGANPFLALIGHYEKSDKPKKQEKSKEKKVAPETWEEKNYIRKHAIEAAEKRTFLLFDIYKKVHGMPSYT